MALISTDSPVFLREKRVLRSLIAALTSPTAAQLVPLELGKLVQNLAVRSPGRG
jgi:hypothetical protein